MARMRNIRVWDVAPGSIAEGIYRPLLAAKGVSGRAQVRVSRQIRLGIQHVLSDMVDDIEAQGFGRKGDAISAMKRGIRVYGTKLTDLRGHILGPGYIVAHEKGSTITPKRGEYLAIPLPAALRPDGTPKLPRPIMWKNTVGSFTWKSKKTGRVYIVYRRGGSLVLLYALVESVQLRKWTGFMTRAWEAQQGNLIRYFARALLFEFDQVYIPGVARIKVKNSTYKRPSENLGRINTARGVSRGPKKR